MDWGAFASSVEGLKSRGADLQKRIRGLRRRLTLLLAVIGPGLITSNVDNDAGGISVYTQAGAQYGYALLWSLVPMTIALYVTEEMCARMGVVTGKGLSDLIRGIRVPADLFRYDYGLFCGSGKCCGGVCGRSRGHGNLSRKQVHRRARGSDHRMDSGASRNVPSGRGHFSLCVRLVPLLPVFRLSGKTGLAARRGAHGDTQSAPRFRLPNHAHRARRNDDCSLAVFLSAGRICGKEGWTATVSASARGCPLRKRELHGDRVLHHRLHGSDALDLGPPRHH